MVQCLSSIHAHIEKYNEKICHRVEEVSAGHRLDKGIHTIQKLAKDGRFLQQSTHSCSSSQHHWEMQCQVTGKKLVGGWRGWLEAETRLTVTYGSQLRKC